MAKAPEPASTAAAATTTAAADPAPSAAPAAPAPAAAATPTAHSHARHRVTVAAGRSVVHQVQLGTKLNADGKEVPHIVHKTAGPGETIEVSPEDAVLLAANGSLHLTPAAAAAAAPPATPTSVPTTTINGDDGSIIRPG